MNKKLLSLLFFGLLLINGVFGIMLIENSKYVYYINNSVPKININLTNPSELVNVSYANLTINEQNYIYEVNQVLIPTQSSSFYFDFNEKISNISETDEVRFILNAHNELKQKIVPKGDPVDFLVKLDVQKPQIVNPTLNNISIYYSNPIQNFAFNEKINSYQIYMDDIIFENKTYFYSFYSDYPNNFNLNFNNSLEGEHTLKVIVKDLAGNIQTSNFILFYYDKPLTISLLTKAEDSNLKYYYNKSFVDFFNKTIYTSDAIFDLKLSTSKFAICYYSDMEYSFPNYGDFDVNSVGVKKFSSNSDGLIHTLTVDANQYLDGNYKQIYVVCRSKNVKSDYVTLSQSMDISNSLITLKVYSNPLNIVNYAPIGEVTANSFLSSITTNQRAICQLSLDNSTSLVMNSVNYLSYTSSFSSISNGVHNLNFDCFDVLNTHVKQTSVITVNDTSAIKVISYSPKYSAISQTFINIILSEDGVCKYSNLSSISPAGFDSLTNLSGFGVNRNFQKSLVSGENIVYIYCKKNNQIQEGIPLLIYYSLNGPVISNLTFINNGIESDYVSNIKEISFKFDVNSEIPVEKYYVTLFTLNSTSIREITSNVATIKGDFESVTKISIIGENLAKRNGTILEKEIKFDLGNPSISFSSNNGQVKIICFDLESGCNNLKYGISSTLLDCITKTSYSLNTSIQIQKDSYVCAEGFDKVGNRGHKIELISLYPIVNDTENKNISEDNILDEDDTNYEDPFISTNYDDTTADTGFNYGLFAAVMLILAGVSGGGYYAYKKGYLNKELERFGIKKPSSTISSNDLKSNTVNQEDLSGNTSNNKLSNGKLTKSKYEEHLNKLNSFVDETIQKRKGTFDKFSDSKLDKKRTLKSGVKGANYKKRKNSEDMMTQEDFDEFYSDKSDSKEIKSGELNYKREAENFEDYYEKKKRNLENTQNNKKDKK